MSQLLDALDEVGAAAKTRGDLGVGDAVASPAQHPTLERSQHVALETSPARPRKVRQPLHLPNPLRAPAEAPGDLCLVHPLLHEPEHTPLDRAKRVEAMIGHALIVPTSHQNEPWYHSTRRRGGRSRSRSRKATATPNTKPLTRAAQATPEF